jgi:hypothetical protein
MTTDAVSTRKSRHGEQATALPSYLASVEKPKGLMLKMLYGYARRQFGTVASSVQRAPAAATLHGADRGKPYVLLVRFEPDGKRYSFASSRDVFEHGRHLEVGIISQTPVVPRDPDSAKIGTI